MKKIWVDRSRAQDYLRCKRLRLIGYHLGSAKMGLVPKRKNIHLTIGGATHSGLEVLLRSAMERGSDWGRIESDLRAIEDLAVDAALADLAEMMKYGVELDTIEQPDPSKPQLDPTASASPVQSAFVSGESPLILDFDLGVIDASADPAPASADPAPDFSSPIYASSHSSLSPSSSPTLDLSDEEARALNQEISSSANAARDAGVDDYLKKELAALVEGMTRAYSRRRLKPLLDSYEVLEVEREGSWKLGEVPASGICACSHEKFEHEPECLYCDCASFLPTQQSAELFWMSRHDALLLHRSTSYLYLLSFKTTGSWDRRKKQDAEIDMQGLSEAVDVENRMAEAWTIAIKWKELAQSQLSREAAVALADPHHPEMIRVASLVSIRIFEWLSTLPAPPKIHAVRYEYLLKGSRREEKDTNPKRYVQDTPLIRAYTQEGMTYQDRAWAASYKWFDLSGKGHTLPYRTWKKTNVWDHMPISAWIDLLDAGEVQPDTYDEVGHPVDILADQFIPPIEVYRNSDDMLDWLEQIEAQEIQVAIDVERVQAAKDEGERRSLLNKLFGQSRSHCVYPGKCGCYEICYGGEDIRRDPEHNSDLYMPRVANHPIESQGAGLTTTPQIT